MQSDDSGHQEGIIPRSIEYLFSRLFGQSSNDSMDPGSFGASYFEIYNESVYDLLKWNDCPLGVKWDAGQGFHAPDLHIQPCENIQDAFTVFSLGNRRRIRSHALNAESSRSHAIFTLYIGESFSEDSVRGCSSKVVFVDLAGSERVKESCAEDNNSIKEAANINKSLFMLGKVISALAAGLTGPLIPYRESKLTKILIGSMAGPSKCLMIACCSPRYAISFTPT